MLARIFIYRARRGKRTRALNLRKTFSARCDRAETKQAVINVRGNYRPLRFNLFLMPEIFLYACEASDRCSFFFFVYVSDRRFSVAHKWNSTNIFTEYFCTKIAWCGHQFTNLAIAAHIASVIIKQIFS